MKLTVSVDVERMTLGVGSVLKLGIDFLVSKEMNQEQEWISFHQGYLSTLEPSVIWTVSVSSAGLSISHWKSGSGSLQRYKE